MKKLILILFFGLIFSCSTASKTGVSTTFSPDVTVVSIAELSKLTSAEKYFDRKIGFTGKFNRIHTQVSWAGMEQYKNTHFLISVTSRNDVFMLPYVLVPAHEQVLTRLKQGDLVSVEGVVEHLTDNFTYIVVASLRNLSNPTPPAITDSTASTMKNP